MAVFYVQLVAVVTQLSRMLSVPGESSLSSNRSVSQTPYPGLARDAYIGLLV